MTKIFQFALPAAGSRYLPVRPLTYRMSPLSLTSTAGGDQAVVKQRNAFLLQLWSEVDQQVAAAQNIQLGKGRVHDEVLHGKDHHFPDLRAQLVAEFNFDKEPA